MGKKGAKRKTRWRTLSIGTPPGEEDEEEGSRNGYGQTKPGHHQDGSNGSNGSSSRERNGNGYGYGSSWLKSRHSSAGSTTSGYASGSGNGSNGSRSRTGRDDLSGSPPAAGHLQHQQQQKQKILFNEDEYTRITTPRQDMLFKKSYLAQRKPWTSSAASMSASMSPSTAESQSASHSTAGRDGSETAEDQQLLDSSCGNGALGDLVAPMLEPPPALSYGTYYDHASGYYYECPMMLVGPAVPEPLAPNVLAAMPCGPVPLRPIEWVNPAFVPKLASQQCCYMNYQTDFPQQTTQGTTDCAALVDAQTVPVSVETMTNGLSIEAGSASSGSVEADEEAESSHVQQHQLIAAEQPLAEPELQNLPQEELPLEPLETLETLEALETLEQPESVDYAPEPGYVETLPPQSLHLGHCMPAQPSYIYPGQYMFGPPVINVNGVTMQSGPMLRYSDMVPSNADVACIKRRKKKKKKKQQKRITGNVDEDDEFSSEGENVYPCTRQYSWSTPTPTTPIHFSNSTSTSNIGNCSSSSRPLNPECQEFHLRSPTETEVLVNAVSDNQVLLYECASTQLMPTEAVNGIGTEQQQQQLPPEYVYGYPSAYEAPQVLFDHTNNESIRLTEPQPKAVAIVASDERKYEDETTTTTTKEIVDKDERNEEVKEVVTNGATAPLTNGDLEANDHDSDDDDSRKTPSDSHDESRQTPSSNGPTSPKRANGNSNNNNKLSARTFKVVREPTPGPDCSTEASKDAENVDDVTNMISSTSIVETQTSQKDRDLDICQTWVRNESSITSESCCCWNENNETKISTAMAVAAAEAATTTAMTTMTTLTTLTTTTTKTATIAEDSGFESHQQPGLRASGRPITDAVNEWLKRVNSPDLFIVTSSATSDEDESDEDDRTKKKKVKSLNVAVNNEPSKNLQGNPMPALSVNGGAEEREPSRGKFASPDDETMAEDLSIEESSKGRDTCFKSAKTKKTRKKKIKSMKSTNKVCDATVDSDSCKEQKQKLAVAQDHSYTSVDMASCNKTSSSSLKRKMDENCEFTDEDSDVGVRVAKNSRINAKRAREELVASDAQALDHYYDDNNNNNNNKNDCKRKQIIEVQPVKTYEKGEIVVSMDGGLLLVAPTTFEDKTEKTEKRRNSGSSSATPDEQERSLGSIEEPDVLEYWEESPLSPITMTKNTEQEGLIDEDLAMIVDKDDYEASDRMEHVQVYYRLQAGSSVTSTEEEEEVVAAAEKNGKASLRSAPNDYSDCASDGTCSSLDEEEMAVATVTATAVIVPEARAKSIGDDGSRIPIDEALEAYESCYTDRSAAFSYASINRKFERAQLFGRVGEGAIPCKAVCCNIQ